MISIKSNRVRGGAFIACIFFASLSAADLKTARAPFFTLKTVKGENFALEQNIGKGPMVINFWATWCGPCILEMKNLKPLHAKYSNKGLLMLSVSIDDNKTAAQVPGIIRTYKFPYTVLLDPNKEAFRAFHAANVPELFIIDKEGMIVYHHSGYQKGDEKKVDETVAKLLEDTQTEKEKSIR
jgi:cytochrome c biogenesis protein CcmG, thiol:disulfide interchange protein DsbE